MSPIPVGKVDLSKAGDPPVIPIPQVDNAAVLKDTPQNDPPNDAGKNPVKSTSVSPLVDKLRKQMADLKSQGQTGPKPFPSVPPAIRTGKAEGQAQIPDPRQIRNQNKVGRSPVRKPDGSWDIQLPYDLPNGDLVVYELFPPSNTPTHRMTNPEILMHTHHIRIIKQSDPDQMYPFLMDCSCGTQARVFTEDDARTAADNHIAIRVKKEQPKNK